MESLSVLNNRRALFKSGQGAGKSGSYFFFSSDSRFIIKTLQGSEKTILFDMLDDLIWGAEGASRLGVVAPTVLNSSFECFRVFIDHLAADVRKLSTPPEDFQAFFRLVESNCSPTCTRGLSAHLFLISGNQWCAAASDGKKNAPSS